MLYICLYIHTLLCNRHGTSQYSPPSERRILTLSQTHTLERDIFGDGSELSSEEEGTSSPCPPPSFQPHLSADVPQHRQRPRPAPVEQEVSASSAESSDAYEQERLEKQKRKVKRRTDDRDARQAQKKRKRKQITEQDLNDLPPEKGLSFPLSH